LSKTSEVCTHCRHEIITVNTGDYVASEQTVNGESEAEMIILGKAITSVDEIGAFEEWVAWLEHVENLEWSLGFGESAKRMMNSAR